MTSPQLPTLKELFATPDQLHSTLCWCMICSGVATFVALMLGITAPYGRYSRNGWGLFIGARIAWLTQEIPSLLAPIALTLICPHASFLDHPFSRRTLCAAAFLFHYTYRSLIFPCLIRGGKGTPVSVWLMSVVFCIWNGYLQGWQLVLRTPADEALDSLATIGLALWATGLLVNAHSDHVLRNLRKPGESGYKIPRGGMFKFVSAANYFGEILEWCGWALAQQSLAAAAFAFFTFCNLAPRADAHHKWYQGKFDDYPKMRKAIIPFLW